MLNQLQWCRMKVTSSDHEEFDRKKEDPRPKSQLVNFIAIDLSNKTISWTYMFVFCLKYHVYLCFIKKWTMNNEQLHLGRSRSYYTGRSCYILMSTPNLCKLCFYVHFTKNWSSTDFTKRNAKITIKQVQIYRFCTATTNIIFYKSFQFTVDVDYINNVELCFTNMKAVFRQNKKIIT